MSDNEYTVIGALLLSPSSIGEVDLVPGDFSAETWRIVYQSILDSVTDSQVVDAVTIGSKLSKKHPDVNWIPLLGKAVKDCPSALNVSAYANLVKAESRNRQAKSICSDVLNNIDNDQNGDVVDDAVRKLMELSNTRRNHECSIKQALSKAVEIIDVAQNKDGTIGLPTGLKKLDDVLGGLHDSDLYVIGARPAMGKTAFLLNLASAHSEPVGLISSEQPSEQVGLRLIAINGRVSAQHMRSGNMTDEDWKKTTLAIHKLSTNNNIWINDKSGINIVDLVRQARQWKHKHNIKAIYIDYIQRIKWTDQRIARWEQVGNVVMALKELARDLDIPVVALAQVNRAVDSRDDKQPRMGDLANSSEIEKEADVIMTLYRDDVENEDSPDAGTMVIDVCKNRHGPVGYVRAFWIAPYMRVDNFENLTYQQSKTVRQQ